MLVLSREKDQRIRIGRDIVLTIVAVNKGKVRVGIEAPKDMEVHRDEVFRKIHREGGKEPS